jgi:hypothetical protein
MPAILSVGRGLPDCRRHLLKASVFRYASGRDRANNARAPISPRTFDDVAVVDTHPFEQRRRQEISGCFPKTVVITHTHDKCW